MANKVFLALFGAACIATLVSANEITCYRCRGFREDMAEGDNNQKECEIYGFNKDKVKTVSNKTDDADKVFDCFTTVFYDPKHNKGEPFTIRGIYGHRTDHRNRSAAEEAIIDGLFDEDEDLLNAINGNGGARDFKLMPLEASTNLKELKEEGEHFYVFMDICESNLCNDVENGVGKIIPGILCLVLATLTSLYIF